jgi:hypothetical protein
VDEEQRRDRTLEAFELIAEELEKLRMLREHEMGVRTEYEEGGSVREAGRGEVGGENGYDGGAAEAASRAPPAHGQASAPYIAGPAPPPAFSARVLLRACGS